MDITRAVTGRLGEQRVNHPDHWSVIFSLKQILDFWNVLQKARKIEIALDLLGHCGSGPARA